MARGSRLDEFDVRIVIAACYLHGLKTSEVARRIDMSGRNIRKRRSDVEEFGQMCHEAEMGRAEGVCEIINCTPEELDEAWAKNAAPKLLSTPVSLRELRSQSTWEAADIPGPRPTEIEPEPEPPDTEPVPEPAPPEPIEITVIPDTLAITAADLGLVESREALRKARDDYDALIWRTARDPDARGQSTALGLLYKHLREPEDRARTARLIFEAREPPVDAGGTQITTRQPMTTLVIPRNGTEGDVEGEIIDVEIASK